MEAAFRAYQTVTQKEFRDQLVVEHLESVRHVLGRLMIGLPGFVDFDNLESAGILGLVEAAAQFDAGRGVEFKTFAYHRIRGAMLDELRRNCPLPQNLLQQWAQIRSTWDQLGEHASPETVARQCGMTESEVEDCIAAVRLAQPESWHEEITSWKRPRGFNEASQNDIDQTEERQQLLAAAIEQLPDRMRVILSLYFIEELRLAEIGEVLGLSESRVSRLMTQAQLQLKQIIERQLSR